MEKNNIVEGLTTTQLVADVIDVPLPRMFMANTSVG